VLNFVNYLHHLYHKVLEKNYFYNLDQNGIIDLRTIDHVGCEMFAKMVFKLLQTLDTDRAKVISVECFENSTNSAIYGI